MGGVLRWVREVGLELGFGKRLRIGRIGRRADVGQRVAELCTGRI